MALRIACFFLIACGGVIMAASTVRYHRFVRSVRAGLYHLVPSSRTVEILVQCAMVFFIIGYGVGALDVLLRPVEPIFLFIGVVFFVGALFVMALIHGQIAMARALQANSRDAMRSFVNSIEMKDTYTQGHSLHVYHIVELLYPCLPEDIRRRVNLAKLLDAALLHDIGKMGVPDEILKKKGPLNSDEWEAIRAHPRRGKQMLAGTGYCEISDWVLYHHERMDGAGYYGIEGAAVPVEAKIIAVADAYSAMTTDREYRPRRTHSEALAILREVAGTQLDAVLVERFCAIDPDDLDRLAEQLLMQRVEAKEEAILNESS